MATIDDLRAYGANVDEGLKRCMNNEAIYLRLVGTLKGEQAFGRLADAVAAGDLDAAFEASHALKGSLGNLSITPLYDPVCEICELLRAKTQMDYTPLMNTINEQHDKLVALL